MSKTADKRLKRRVESAEYLWQQAQLKAATAQSVLDYMVDQYNKHKEELQKEHREQTEEQIALRQKEIKDYLMDEKALYEKRIGVVQ